jgi:hypothetical protein
MHSTGRWQQMPCARTRPSPCTVHWMTDVSIAAWRPGAAAHAAALLCSLALRARCSTGSTRCREAAAWPLPSALCCCMLRCHHSGSSMPQRCCGLCRHQAQAGVRARAGSRSTMALGSAAHPAVRVPDGDCGDVGHRLQLPLSGEGLVVHRQLQQGGSRRSSCVSTTCGNTCAAAV